MILYWVTGPEPSAMLIAAAAGAAIALLNGCVPNCHSTTLLKTQGLLHTHHSRQGTALLNNKQYSFLCYFISSYTQ